MRHSRIIILVLWIAAFVASYVIVQKFLHQTVWNANLQRQLAAVLPQDRPMVEGKALAPLIKLYASYVGGGLSFLFLSQAWLKDNTKKDDPVRLFFAIVCTVIFNIFVLNALRSAFQVNATGQTLIDSSAYAAKLGGWLSFLVAPLQSLYFAFPKSKRAEGAEGEHNPSVDKPSPNGDDPAQKKEKTTGETPKL